MPFLVWETPQGRQARALDRSLLLLGRDPVSDLHIDDATVSRRHLLVQVQGARITLTDLGSSTGTRINGAALTRDMPSTLVVGDLIQVGQVRMSCEAQLPVKPAPAPARTAVPAAAPAAPPGAAAQPDSPRPALPSARPRAPRVQPPPASPPRGDGQKMILGLVFVVVVLIGAVIALLVGDNRSPRTIVEMVESSQGAERAETPAQEPVPVPLTPPPLPAPIESAPIEPQKEQGPKRAAMGALPPSIPASIADAPELLEIDGAQYAPVSLRDWNDASIEALGADGLLYTVARARVTKIESREDLSRRARSAASQLASEDGAGRVALGRWCLQRLLLDEARLLAREALRQSPNDAPARALLADAGGA